MANDVDVHLSLIADIGLEDRVYEGKKEWEERVIIRKATVSST